MYLETPTVSQLRDIPNGKAGILATLKEMARLARLGKRMFAVHRAALARTRQCNQKDYACEAAALHQFVRDSIRYVQDPIDVERIQSPDKTLELAAGDCDDKAILLASLLESIGHPTRFIAIGFEPGVFSHVYVETKIGDVWTAAETTEPVEFGWEPDASVVRARMNHYI